MRPSRTVARAALTAVLALGALPGLVGSHEPARDAPINAALFQQLDLANRPAAMGLPELALDRAARSSSILDAAARFEEGLTAEAAPPDERATPQLQAARAGWAWKEPRFTMTGFASFYDHGTTAMRDVPRGTVIVICGEGGCMETRVSDYGPAKSTGRIIDMYRPDFFRICGCGWWSGTTTVTVRVY